MTTSLNCLPPPVRRDTWTDVGLVLVGIAAAATSWAGWVGLGERCGVDGDIPLFNTGWSIRLSWLLPIAVDVYALTASRVWLRVPGLSQRTRDYARANALGAVTVSIAGNAFYHWLAAHGENAKPSMWLIAGVASIAPLMLGLVGHLSSMMADDRRPIDPGTTEAPPGISNTSAAAEEQIPGLVPVNPHTQDDTPAATPEDNAPPRMSRRDATARMRTFWQNERAAGRVPAATDLETAAEVLLSDGYARRLRRQWLADEN